MKQILEDYGVFGFKTYLMILADGGYQTDFQAIDEFLVRSLKTHPGIPSRQQAGEQKQISLLTRSCSSFNLVLFIEL